MAQIIRRLTLGLQSRSPHGYSITLLSLSGGGFRASLYHGGVLRALYKADKLNYATFVNAVSGGAIPAIIWDTFLSKSNSFERVSPSWPEETLLDFIFGTPRLGGQYNWWVRYLILRDNWAKYLHKWWNRIQQSLSGHEPDHTGGRRPNILLETIDFLRGDIWVFTRGSLLIPDREFFKTGESGVSGGYADIEEPLAIAASTAFPLYFRPVRILDPSLPNFRLELRDAGLVDNMAISVFLTLFQKSTEGELLLQKGDEWFFADASRAMAVVSPVYGFKEGLTVRKLSMADRIFRLTGDLYQPLYASNVQGFLNGYSPVSAKGVKIGIIPTDEEPWLVTERLNDPRMASTVPTGFFPLPRSDALV